MREGIIEAKKKLVNSFILCLLLKFFEITAFLEMSKFIPELFNLVVVVMNGGGVFMQGS